MSASASTMNGSLPPSSRTVFFRARPAMPATARPAPVDPVRVTAATRSSLMIRSLTSGVRSKPATTTENRSGDGEEAARDLLQQQGAARRGGSMLEHHHVPGGYRGSKRPDHLPVREVPRHDRKKDAQRAVHDPADGGRRCRSTPGPAEPVRDRRTIRRSTRTSRPRLGSGPEACPSHGWPAGPTRRRVPAWPARSSGPPPPARSREPLATGPRPAGHGPGWRLSVRRTSPRRRRAGIRWRGRWW